ncbi:MAG: hypothetical protein JW969_12775 [Spirochaetales bacterium]|nr:hypothetical protein [Spirochaetales bacterium]
MRKNLIKIVLAICLSMFIFGCYMADRESPASEQGVTRGCWSSSAQYATWSDGTYSVCNNVWGSGAGYQNLWVCSYYNWGIYCNHPYGSGNVKSYPSVRKVINQRLSSISQLKSTCTYTLPGSGTWNAAYDIWCDGMACEVMVWTYRKNQIPLGTYQTNVTVGGNNCNVYKGYSKNGLVVTFVRTSNTTSGYVNIKDVLNWVKNRGWFGDVTVRQVEFGFEVVQCTGEFKLRGYSLY